RLRQRGSAWIVRKVCARNGRNYGGRSGNGNRAVIRTIPMKIRAWREEAGNGSVAWNKYRVGGRSCARAAYDRSPAATTMRDFCARETVGFWGIRERLP